MRLLAFIFILAIPFVGFGQDFPEKSNRLVNDYTGTLSTIDLAKLENKLVQYDLESSVQIAIVVIKSLGGYEISDYAFQLGERWGIGQADRDNGALILVSMNDRKMWIATGYGLEATVTDALCKRIIENEMKPRFKSDFAGGLSAASDAIIQASRGEYQGKDNGGEGQGPPVAAFIVIILVFGLIWFIKAMQVRRYARLNHMGFWAAWMLLNASSRRHSGSWSNFSGGGGSFGGGGGFGGFGGGSFGGGGAGGSW
jgi:uncharacterized protein